MDKILGCLCLHYFGYVFITLDMSTRLWLCLYYSVSITLDLSSLPLLWLHFLCLYVHYHGYVYITLSPPSLCVVCLHVIQCAGEALSSSAGVVSGSLWFSIPPVRPVFINSTSHSCVHLFRWMSVFVL